MKRILKIIAVVVIALAALVYFAPLAVFEAFSSARLRLAGFRSEFVQVGPHRIRVLVGGEGAPLVLIHGVASKAGDWSPILSPLAQQHRIYAIDLLGYGESDKPKDADYSITLETNIVRGAMDALHIARADIAGWSMGGWIAMKLAAENPERVRRLVLIASAGFSFPNKFTPTTFTPTTVEGMRAFIAMQTDKKVPDFMLRDFIRRRRDTRFVVERGMASMLTLHDAMEGKLARVTMPVLIVAGTNDRIVPFDVAVRIKREIPQARLEPLDGCGHLIVWDCRDGVLARVTPFLATQNPPP